METARQGSGSLIECVPNFSEGRDQACINALEQAISGIPGVVVLHRTSDPDHNRSVITFAGPPRPVLDAAVRAVAKSAELIDLSSHRGVHPRLGALDVLPFVPLEGATLEQCVEIAHTAGQRIWQELRIPVYFYEAAANHPQRVRLEDVRRGEFEHLLDAVLLDESKAPDLGGPGLHPTAGAVIVGARKVLIAFNVNLNSTDLQVAKRIAKAIRASSGGLSHVKALGLPLVSRNRVQVSINLTDYERTPLHVVYEEVRRLATNEGVEIAESELIGLIPRAAVEMAFAGLLRVADFHSGRVIENKLEAALRRDFAV